MKKLIKLAASLIAALCLYCAGAFSYGAIGYYFSEERAQAIANNKVFHSRLPAGQR